MSSCEECRYFENAFNGTLRAIQDHGEFQPVLSSDTSYLCAPFFVAASPWDGSEGKFDHMAL